MATSTTPVDDLIAAFGGGTLFLRRIGQRYPSILTVWRRRQRIPHYRYYQIKDAAERFGVNVRDDLLRRLFPTRGRSPADKPGRRVAA